MGHLVLVHEHDVLIVIIACEHLALCEQLAWKVLTSMHCRIAAKNKRRLHGLSETSCVDHSSITMNAILSSGTSMRS